MKYTVRPHTISEKILIEIAKVGEYPYDLIDYISPTSPHRIIVRYIKKLIDSSYIKKRNTDVGKTLKLRSKGLDYIKNNFEDTYYPEYMDITYDNLSMSGAALRKLIKTARVKKITEMCGFKVLSWEKPFLDIDNNDLSVSKNDFLFYESKEIKRIDKNVMKKVDYTRNIGVLFFDGDIVPVYNLGGGLVSWSNQGEKKLITVLNMLGRKNVEEYKNKKVEKAYMYCDNLDVVNTFLNSEKTLFKKDKTKPYDIFSFDNVYKHMHFIPLNERGVKITYFLTLDFKSIIDDFLYSNLKKNIENVKFDCDFIDENDNIHLNLLDFDFTKLKNIKRAFLVFNLNPEKINLHIFDLQENVVRKFFPEANIKKYSFDNFYERI